MPRKIKKKGPVKKVNPSDVYVPESIQKKGNMNLGKKYPPQAMDYFSKDNDYPV